MDKKYIVGGSFAVAFLAIIISGPKVAENLRPLKNDRMQDGFGVYTDKDTGKIYGFILVQEVNKDLFNLIKTLKIKYAKRG